MGRRIHKRPGTEAHKKALEKSASRMARDMLRARPEKVGEILISYARNKTPEEIEALFGKIDESEERPGLIDAFAERLRPRVRESSQALGSAERVFKQMKEVIAKKTAKAKKAKLSAEDRRTLKNAFDIAIKEGFLTLNAMRFLEKTLPKEELRELELKKKRAKFQKEFTLFIKNVSDLEEENRKNGLNG